MKQILNYLYIAYMQGFSIGLMHEYTKKFYALYLQ